jgi:TolB protein
MALLCLFLACSSADGDAAPIAYSKGGNIWVIDPSSQESQQLTSHPAFDGFPSWHPDGQSLIFVSTRNEGVSQLFSMLADGSSIRHLGRPGTYPTYAPDGIRIAYVKANQLVVSEDDEDNPYPVLTMTAVGDIYFSSPSWSPGGDRLVFGVSPGLLYVIGTDEFCEWESASHCPSLRRLVHGRVDDSRPAWSPDGGLIVFQDHFRLSVIRPDGSGLRFLTPSDLLATQPTWSPDGQTVAFVGGPDRDLYLVDRDGTSVRKLTSGGGIQTPAWRHPLPESQITESSWGLVKDIR